MKVSNQVGQRSNADADDQEQKRRAEVKEILSFFSASRGRLLRHECRPGCCADRAASVDKAFGLVKRFVTPCISEPAANKYTKVDPVIRKLALATNFFGLLRRAFARKFKDTEQDESDRSDISVDAAIGVPRDANRHWRKVKHIKMNRYQRVFALDLALRVLLHHDCALQAFQEWHLVQPSEDAGSMQHL